jgi:hypothetical protein
MMQLAVLQGMHNCRLDLQWRPRQANTEADDLTNAKFDNFDMNKRINKDWNGLSLKLLNKMSPMFPDFVDEINSHRHSPKTKFEGDTSRKKRRHEKTHWG